MTYQVSVRGEVPSDLTARVSALHAEGIMSGRQVDGLPVDIPRAPTAAAVSTTPREDAA